MIVSAVLIFWTFIATACCARGSRVHDDDDASEGYAGDDGSAGCIAPGDTCDAGVGSIRYITD